MLMLLWKMGNIYFLQQQKLLAESINTDGIQKLF